MASPHSTRHVAALDGLRGTAALMVLGYHFHLPGILGGFLGVQIFFTLSGFLITGVLLDELDSNGQFDFRRFLVRRARRLLPALAMMLALLSPLSSLPQIVSSIGYFSNMARAFQWWPMGLLDHTWSLAVEGQFYLLWPLILTFGWPRLARPALRTVLVAAAVALVLLRVLLWLDGVSFEFIYFSTLTVADSLVIGSALSVASRLTPWRPPPVLSGLSCLAALVVLGACAFLRPENTPLFLVAVSIIPMAASVIIADALVSPRGVMARFLSHPFLVWTGQISYSLYLWHRPISFLLPPALGIPLSFAAAAISYRWVEEPFLQLRGSAQSVPHRSKPQPFNKP